ncbi:LuxR C-terminal-related transcriptional regulator [Nocardia sp. MDA0666]|uniref:LuxR C-terminal-related transcriptional regulator n=1 Tax=Nocardia sp. MDA0666 TaxID=2135448 RepID=UPI001E2FB5CC|nr:LuxR C-terminal-related transcriptional regulator [Nocardia sp. MDA0666]
MTVVGNLAVAFGAIPGAREILRELDSGSPDPLVYLIRGRCGTGKSTLLAAVRNRLRRSGIGCFDDVSATTTPPDTRAAVVVDDAHTLDQLQLEKLCAAVESDSRTIIVATRPQPHDTALRALADAVSRRGRVVDLRPLGTADIAPFARELGMTVPRAVADHIHRHTGGIPGGVVAALTAACATRLEGGIEAVDQAVTSWARTLLDDTEPQLLEVLTVATTGAGLDPSELAEVLGTDEATAVGLVDRARAGALITDADLLLSPAIEPLRTLVGERRFVSIQRRLLTARLEAGLLRDHTALQLAESGVRDERLAEFLRAAADTAGSEASRYYTAAVASGYEAQRIAVPRATAAVFGGDDESALRLAEPVLARTDAEPAELAAAVRICASVQARRGLIGRAVQLYSWLGTSRTGADWATAAAVFHLAGAVGDARAVSGSAAQWPPTETNARTGRFATALAQSITGESRSAATSAAAALIQLARTAAPEDRMLPCAPVALATLLCLSMGEPRRAADALRGTDPHDPQIRVLTAWTAMLGGDEQTAAKTVAAVDTTALPPRDRLLAHGVLVGLARRAGDHGVLLRAWEAAYPTFDEVDADLPALLPIGELWLAAIRLGEQERIIRLVEAARDVLRSAGNPPAWANVFHWYEIQAAIAHERPDELMPPARLLKTAAQAGDPHAAILADAGRTWVLVLRGEVAEDRVTAAVRRLAAIGMVWDAARLASEAALSAGDPATATALLKLARTVRTGSRPSAAPERTPAAPRAATAPEPAAASVLSEREREVAELVLLGLTYREIGARLYISAKTVEHHVARIRRRIGAGSRSELLSMLRAMGHGSLLV